MIDRAMLDLAMLDIIGIARRRHALSMAIL